MLPQTGRCGFWSPEGRASLGASREEEGHPAGRGPSGLLPQKANPRSLHLTRKHSSLVEGKPGPPPTTTKVRNKQKKRKKAGGVNIEKN